MKYLKLSKLNQAHTFYSELTCCNVLIVGLFIYRANFYTYIIIRMQEMETVCYFMCMWFSGLPENLQEAKDEAYI